MPNALLNYIVQHLPLNWLQGLYAKKGLKSIWHFFSRSQNSDALITSVDARFRIGDNHYHFKFACPIKMALKVADNGLESRTIRRVFHYAKMLESGCILDVGVNYGFLSAVWAKALPHYQIIGFEANHTISVVCNNNMKENSLFNVEIQNLAISNKEASGKLYRDDALKNKATEGNSAVKAISLDEFYQHNSKPIVAVKIDTDGHDYACLEGALGIIKRYYPMLVIELNGDVQIITRLLELGYRVFDVELTPLVDEDATIADLKRIENVYAYHPNGPVPFERLDWIKK